MEVKLVKYPQPYPCWMIISHNPRASGIIISSSNSSSYLKTYLLLKAIVFFCWKHCIKKKTRLIYFVLKNIKTLNYKLFVLKNMSWDESILELLD